MTYFRGDRYQSRRADGTDSSYWIKFEPIKVSHRRSDPYVLDKRRILGTDFISPESWTH